MDFLRRHVFFIICGVVAIVGIGVGVTGLNAMPDVLTEMEESKALYSQLGSLQSRPVNQRFISSAEDHIGRIKGDRDAVFGKVRETNRYTPLVDDVFPDLDQPKEAEFRRKYVDELDRLYKMLQAGEPAKERDVERYEDLIAREEAEQARDRQNLDEGVEVPEEEVPLGNPFTPGMVLTKDGARTDAVARAQMGTAQSIRCYATPPLPFSSKASWIPSLEIERGVPPTGTMELVSARDLWWAQLGLWIQGDVVRTIKKLNDVAAEEYNKLPKGNEEDRAPWVGVMPIKEFISIRLSESYIQEEDDASDRDEAWWFPKESAPPASPKNVFTHSWCTSLYEVMQFSVKMVMDQREISRFVDELTSNDFHTLLRLSYRAVPPDRTMHGKIYGSDPTVVVVMDFETIMLGSLFRCWMPEAVLDELEYAERPEECAGETEEEDNE